MVSKKLIAPTLAGTGAAGAAGTMAWALGLFDGEGLEDEPKAKVAEGTPKESRNTVPPGGIRERQGAILAGRAIITGQSAINPYFSSQTASDADKKAIKQSTTWKVEWNDGLKSLWVEAEGAPEEDGTNFSWKCRLMPIFLERIESYHDLTDFVNRGRHLIEAIEANNTHREQFVKNCSKRRAAKSENSQNTSEIHLEVEKDGKKFKFKEADKYFQKLWTEDFGGVDILSKDDEELIDVTDEKWNIEEIKGVVDKTKKIKISAKSKNWDCYISGTSRNDLGDKTFKRGELKGILDLNKYYYEKKEKKKYLIRNCRKNGMNIGGLKVKDVGGNQWDFEEESLKKITEGMYENT